jgi:hypothetical protein
MSANTSPSLNFCSSPSKAKPEAMQEIQGDTSIDPCLDLSNGLMRPHLTIPIYLMEGWSKKRNLSSVSLLLSLFLKSIGENVIL